MSRWFRAVAIFITSAVAVAGCGGDCGWTSSGYDMSVTYPRCRDVQPGSDYPTGACTAGGACLDNNSPAVICDCENGMWLCSNHPYIPRDMTPSSD